MKNALTLLALCAALLASPASAACLAEYKAKTSNPTRYQHSTMSVPDSACTVGAAASVVRSRLAGQGWQLLTIVKVTPGG